MGDDSLSIKEGIVSRTAQKIKYKRDGKTRAIIRLSEPVKVVQSEQDEGWGYFQFPTIGKTDDGLLLVSWSLQEDTHKSYGKISSTNNSNRRLSRDKGLSWEFVDRNYEAHFRGYNLTLKDGSVVQELTFPVKDISSFKVFPPPVVNIGSYSYFFMDQLPPELQGFHLSLKKGSKTETIHAKLYDPGLLRYSVGNLMPIVWWGNIKQLANQSLVAGVYPTIYLDSLGNLLPSAVTFYSSEDNLGFWKVLGKIPFLNDGIAYVRGDRRFDEPAFEILKDSTFICVLRTGSVSPLYKSFSFNRGKTWTTPKPFTPNGVMPKLMHLQNGVMVLISGRPGIQIRFSFDGLGQKWSTPIDMISFMNNDGSYNRDVSCGYASFIEATDNSFYIVYSDFTTKDAFGHKRKSIWFRKVTVTRR